MINGLIDDDSNSFKKNGQSPPNLLLQQKNNQDFNAHLHAFWSEDKVQSSTVADTNTVEDSSNIYGLQDETIDFKKYPEFGRQTDAPSTLKEVSFV